MAADRPRLTAPFSAQSSLLQVHGFDFFAMPSNTSPFNATVEVSVRRHPTLINELDTAFSAVLHWQFVAPGYYNAFVKSSQVTDASRHIVRFTFDSAAIGGLRARNYHDCRFGGNLMVESRNAVIEIDAISIALTYVGPLALSAPPRVGAPSSSPEKSLVDHVVELRPTERIDPGLPFKVVTDPNGDLITSSWFTQADDAGDLVFGYFETAMTPKVPPLTFSMGTPAFEPTSERRSEALELGAFEPVQARDSALWPPPASAQLIGAQISFRRGLNWLTPKQSVLDDVRQIALLVKTRANATSMNEFTIAARSACDNNAQAVWQLRSDATAVYGALDGAIGTFEGLAGTDFEVLTLNETTATTAAGDLCSRLRVRLGVRFELTRGAGNLKNVWMRNAISNVRLRIKYRIDAAVPAKVLPVPPAATLELPPTTVSGVNDPQHALFAMEDAALMLSIDSKELAPGTELSVVLGGFGFARLPHGALVRSMRLSVAHALFRTWKCGDDQKHYSCFDDIRWTRIELVDGSRVLASASDLTNCANARREWPSDNCRRKGACLAQAVFRRWSQPLTADALGAAQFAVRLSFQRARFSMTDINSTTSGNEQESEVVRNGLEWQSQFHPRFHGLMAQDDGTVAGLGAVTLAIDYDVAEADETSPRFSSGWLSGSIVRRTGDDTPTRSLVRDAADVSAVFANLAEAVPSNVALVGLEARWKRVNRCQAYPVTAPPTPAPTPMPMNLPSALGVYTPAYEALKSDEEYYCSRFVQNTTRCGFADVTLATARCGDMYDRKYSFAGGAIEDQLGAFTGGSRPWPADYRAPARTFAVGGANYAWLNKSVLTTVLLQKPELRLVAERPIVPPTRPSGVLLDVEMRVHFASSALIAAVPDRCFFRLRGDGSSRVAVDDLEWPAQNGSLSLWFRNRSPALSAAGRVTLFAFGDGTTASSVALQATERALELLTPAVSANASVAVAATVSLVSARDNSALFADREWIPVHLSWQEGIRCLYVGRGDRTLRSCANSTTSTMVGGMAVNGTATTSSVSNDTALPESGAVRGTLVIGAAPSWLNVSESALAIDIDNVGLFETPSTALRRERNWFDTRADTDLLFAHTFVESSGSCTCGNGVFASAFGRAQHRVTVNNIDCNDPRCRIAQAIAPGRTFEASRDRLRAASLALAIDELQSALTACVEADAPLQSPTELAHWYKAVGTGQLMTASTCTQTVVDTRILVLQTDNCTAFTCVAFNDDAIRGAAACGNGGSEVSWQSRVGVTYTIAVLARPSSIAVDAAQPSFTLKLSSCERFTCGFARSCEPCSWRTSVAGASTTTPQRVRLVRKAGANVVAEERCIEPECTGSHTVEIAGVPQLPTVFSTPPTASGVKSVTLLRSNVRVLFRALHFAPATFSEPDFGASLGNDNAAFVASLPFKDFTPAHAEYALRSFCANPVPTAYRVSLVGAALLSERIDTNVTCEPRDANNSSTPRDPIERANTACDDDLFRTTRVRCAASAVPLLPLALRDAARPHAVCRPDAELPVLRTLVAANSSLLGVIATAADEPSAIDCNFPPFADELESNCSANATSRTRGMSVSDSLQQLANSVASGGATLSALESDVVAAAKCDARRRELELRKKVAVAVNPFDCHQCVSGGGVAVRLEPVFDAANAVLCFLERLLPTELHAQVAVEIDGAVVFNDTLRVASDGALGSRGQRVQFARMQLVGAEVDPPERILLAATRESSLAYSAAPRSWVPFATNSRSWANDSCLYEPSSLAAAGSLERTSLPPESFALLDTAGRDSVFSLISKQHRSLRNISNAWQFAPPSAAVGGVRRATVTFEMAGRLLLGLAPRGKVDESSVVARIRLQSTNTTDTVTLSIAGRLLNDFNVTGAAYVFEVTVRDPLTRVYGRWDVLQTVSDRFELEVELDFAHTRVTTAPTAGAPASSDSMVASLMAMIGAAAASVMSADPLAGNATAASTVGNVEQLYASALRIEISDSLATFAVQANPDEVDLSLYAAEQEAVQAEIDARLIPVLAFIGAVPLIGGVLVAIGWCIQRRAPIADEDTRLHRRHCIVIVFYIALRVARSLLLTLTFFSIVLQLVVREPMSTLSTLPVWLDSVSNVSAAIVLRSDIALSVELERQQNLSVSQQQACTLLLAETDRDARSDRIAIEREHARAKDQRDISGLQQRHAAIQQQAIRDAAEAQNAEQAQQTFCWKAFSANLFKTAELYAVDVGKLTALRFGELDAKFDNIVLKQIKPFEVQLKAYVADVNVFVSGALRLTNIIDGFIGGISDAIEFFGIDVPDFRVLPPAPVAVTFPEIDWTFPRDLPDWKLEMLLPPCNCPRDPGEFDVSDVGNEVAPGRNYTAFGPSEPAAEEDGGVPVPLPRVELRSFVSVPTLLNVFGFLPDLTTLFSLTVIIDILMLLFTHIRTVKVVVQLVHGYRFDDEIVDKDTDDEVEGVFGTSIVAGCCACLYRCVDRCNWVLQHYRSLALVIFLYASQVLTAIVGIVIFVLGVWLLVQLIAAVFTVQGFDGLGVFALIASPVTLALGQANVRAIENARQLNQQTLPANALSFLSAQQRVADATNEFNDAQQRDLQLFNTEYCSLLARVDPAVECDPVVQVFAEFNGTLCPHFRAIVPQLFADVDREQFALIVRTSLTPYIDSTRRLLTDIVWLVCSVIVIVMALAFFSTLLYRALVWARMIRRRKRIVFESERALHKHSNELKEKERDERLAMSIGAGSGSHHEFMSTAERPSLVRPPSMRRSNRSRRAESTGALGGVPRTTSSRRRRGVSTRRDQSTMVPMAPMATWSATLPPPIVPDDDDDAPPAPMARSPLTF
jgi:hypothetical protein